MSIVSSNMITKNYCPKCESFDLIKLQRSFLHKHILDSENKMQCRDCGEVSKRQAIEQNIPREVRTFLDSPSSTAAMVSGFQVAGDTPEYDYQVTETYTNKDSFPPEHSGDDQLIDEAIFVKEEKGFWPYIVASLLVMFGAAYSFIWMPMNLSAEEAGTTQIDMTIGKPAELMAEDKLAKQKPVNDEAKSELQVPQKTTLKAVSPKYVPDPGSKADIALGGLMSSDQRPQPKKVLLSSASKELPNEEVIDVVSEVKPATTLIQDESTRLVEVRLPKTYLDIDEKPDQTSIVDDEIQQNTESELETETAATIPVKTVSPVASNRKAAALLGLSMEDLSALTSTSSVRPASITKKQAVAQKVTKRQVPDVNTQLVEKAAVKFMQQDLDKLLPQ